MHLQGCAKTGRALVLVGSNLFVSSLLVESLSVGGFVFHVKQAAMVAAPNDKSKGTFTLTADGPTKVN